MTDLLYAVSTISNFENNQFSNGKSYQSKCLSFGSVWVQILWFLVVPCAEMKDCKKMNSMTNVLSLVLWLSLKARCDADLMIMTILSESSTLDVNVRSRTEVIKVSLRKLQNCDNN